MQSEGGPPRYSEEAPEATIDFQSVKSPRVFEEIVAQIREMIFSGRLKLGDKLPSERELVRQFGASRVTVREALKILEREGLVRIKVGLGGGAFVTQAEPRLVSDALNTLLRSGLVRLSELQQARFVLEPAVAAYVATVIDEEHLEMLRQNVRDARAHAEGGEEFFRLNTEFHNILARASKNFFIEVVFHSLSEMRMSLARSPVESQFNDLIIEVHQTILDCLERHDPDGTRRAMEEHYRHTAAMFGTHL